LRHDNITRLATTSTGISVTGNATFADDGKAIFGAGSDLEIYHDGSESIIKDAGTGNLKILATNLRINNADSSKSYITGVDGSYVNLYYNGSQKLVTTSSGIDVTGTAVTDGLTSSGVLSVDAEAISQIKSGVASDVLRLGNDSGTYVLGFASSLASMDLGASDNFRIRHSSTESFRATPTGVVLNEISNSSVDFRVESDNQANMLFMDAGNDRIGIQTAIPSTTFQVDGLDDGDITWFRGNGTNAGGRALRFGVGNTTRTEFPTYLPNIYSTASDGANSGLAIGMYGGTSGEGAIQFWTGASDAFAEKMRIQRAGNIVAQYGAVFNEGGYNSDFRVESDSQTHALFVDASNDTVGVGTSSVSNTVAANFHGKGILFRNNVNGDNTNWTKLHNTASTDRSNLLIQPSTGSVEITQGGGLTVTNTASYGNVFNEGGVDADFRVESDNETHAIFVDAENDRVGLFASSTASGYALTVGTGGIHLDPDVISRITGTRGYSVATAGGINVFRACTVSGVGSRGRLRAIGSIGYGDPEFVEYFVEMGEGNADDEFGVNVYSVGNPSGQDAFRSNNNQFKVYTNRVDSTTFDLWVEVGHFCRMDFFLEEVGGVTPRFDNSGTSTLPGTAILTNNSSQVQILADTVQLRTQNASQDTLFKNLKATSSETALNDDSQDIDFRVESDGNTHMLFVDANTNAVGIATSGPSSSCALTVGGSAGDGSPPLFVDSTIAASSTFNYVFQGHVTDLPNAKRAALSVGRGHSAYNQTIMGHYNSSADSTSNYGFLGMHNADDAIVWNTSKEVGIAISPSARLHVQGEAGNDTAIFRNGSDAGNGISIQRTDGTEVGSINWASSSTSFNTTSDYRLKENVADLTGAIERVKQLSPKRFNFIIDADTTVDGFLAHEAATVVPEAITGTKDAMKDVEYEVTPAVLDDDGNIVTEAVMGTQSVPDYQGIDQSKLVPLLTAALQEAIAKIETLETKVTALENA